MRKYLFFITGLVMGGAERVMVTLANQFVRHGDAVRLVTMKAAESAYPLDPEVELVGANAVMDTSNPMKAALSAASIVKGVAFYRRQLKEYQPDCVLSFLTYTNLIAVRCRSGNIPVVVSERCDPRERKASLIRQVNSVYPKADCIVCQSKTMEDYFHGVNAASRTAVIPNPVNAESIFTGDVAAREKVIVAAGRLSHQKNYGLLIRAFSLIRDQFPEHVLRIYGQGPEEEKLKQLIAELGLEKQVFLMGVRDNVMKAEAAASLYVMSSNFEGFPNALAEAMASGIPVISTDFASGVARELIADGVNGYVVPLRDEKAMAEKMRVILSDTALQRRMSAENVKIRDTLSEEKIWLQWKELFEGFK